LVIANRHTRVCNNGVAIYSHCEPLYNNGVAIFVYKGNYINV